MNKIRVKIQQPSLAKYRIPFYKMLAEQDGIDLLVYYSINDPTLPNAPPEGFKATYVPMFKIDFLKNHPILWHSAQWLSATKKNSDVLILSWDLHYLSLIPSILRAKINKIPVLLWGHGYSKNENITRKYLRELVAKLATALILYDFNTAKQYIASGFSNEKIFIAPNSIDQAQIKSAKQWWSSGNLELKMIQKAYAINPEHTIIYMGRIYAENKLDILIKTIPNLINNYPDFKLLIIGKESLEASRLKAMSISLKIENHILWLGEIYNEEKIAKWMLSSVAFCYPENIGLSIMHAFGYGLPVITSDNVKSHNPEIYAFANNKNGLFYISGSVEDLTNRICDIFDNKTQTSFLSEGAISTVESIYNIPQMVAGFKKAIFYAYTSAHR